MKKITVLTTMLRNRNELGFISNERLLTEQHIHQTNNNLNKVKISQAFDNLWFMEKLQVRPPKKIILFLITMTVGSTDYQLGSILKKL